MEVHPQSTIHRKKTKRIAPASVIFSVYKSMLIKKEAANGKEWGDPVDGSNADI